jgi:hypothetical protein
MVQYEEIYFSVIQCATQHLSDCPCQFKAQHSSSRYALAMVLRPTVTGEPLTASLTALLHAALLHGRHQELGQLTACPILNAILCS